jgi:hypothetical protein
MISSSSWNIGHLGSKTKSHRPNVGKPCKHSGGNIFSPTIILEIGQNVYFNDFQQNTIESVKMSLPIIDDDYNNS